MATATKTEAIALVLTPDEVTFLRGFLAGCKELTYGAVIRKALETAQAPF